VAAACLVQKGTRYLNHAGFWDMAPSHLYYKIFTQTTHEDVMVIFCTINLFSVLMHVRCIS